MLAGKCGKRRTAGRVEDLTMVGVLIRLWRSRVRHALGQQGRVFQTGQLGAPERLIGCCILPVQPTDVVGKTP